MSWSRSGVKRLKYRCAPPNLANCLQECVLFVMKFTNYCFVSLLVIFFLFNCLFLAKISVGYYWH